MEDNTKIMLPAIAIRGIVPLPSNEFKIEVGRANSVMALDAAEKMYDGNIVLLVQKDGSTDVNKDDIQPIGVLAKITLKLKLPSGNYRVKFKITNRISIVEYTSEDPYFVVNYEKLFSILDNDEMEEALAKNVEKEVISNQSVLASANEVLKLFQSKTNLDVVSDVIAYQLKLNTNQSKYRYLEELSVSKRLNMILEDIEKEKQIVEIENKINKDVKKSIDDSQKEYYLREKMKAIQNELGDKARTEEDIENLRKAINDAHLPEMYIRRQWMNYKNMLQQVIKWLNQV